VISIFINYLAHYLSKIPLINPWFFPLSFREKLKKEEQRTRLINQKFTVPHPNKLEEPYSPQIHTTYPYRGTVDPYTFRENKPDKNISRDTFNTLISPVPIFEKFNKTY